MIAVSKVWRRGFGALRVAAVGLEVRSYFTATVRTRSPVRYFGSYVPGAKVKLDEVSRILGLTGKPEGATVAREEMVLAGQIDEVARYCESDV